MPKQDTMDAPLAPVGFDLAMEDVSFSYDGVRRVIDGVSLSIPEGTTCAHRGARAGAGKDHARDGCSRGSGTSRRRGACCARRGRRARRERRTSLLARFSMVFQGAYLFDDTVRGNICVRSAGRLGRGGRWPRRSGARCHEFIDGAAGGLRHALSRRGAAPRFRAASASASVHRARHPEGRAHRHPRRGRRPSVVYPGDRGRVSAAGRSGARRAARRSSRSRTG